MSRSLIPKIVVPISVVVVIAAVAFILYRRYHKRQARERGHWDNDLLQGETLEGVNGSPFVTTGTAPTHMNAVESGAVLFSPFSRGSYTASTLQMHAEPFNPSMGGSQAMVETKFKGSYKGGSDEVPPPYHLLHTSTSGR